MIWFTADWHFGDPRQTLMGRPFEDEHQCFEYVKQQFNHLVAPDDLVYMVGDIVYQNAADPESWLDKVAEFHGHKCLCRGNHDRIFTDEQLLPYFEKIAAEDDGFLEVLNGKSYYITHYPTSGVQNAFNIVGHIHSAWRVQLNALNVGIDVNHFRPIAFDALPGVIHAIAEVYDEDVWSAYHSSNTTFRYERGKKSRYLDVLGKST